MAQCLHFIAFPSHISLNLAQLINSILCHSATPDTMISNLVKINQNYFFLYRLMHCSASLIITYLIRVLKTMK